MGTHQAKRVAGNTPEAAQKAKPNVTRATFGGKKKHMEPPPGCLLFFRDPIHNITLMHMARNTRITNTYPCKNF